MTILGRFPAPADPCGRTTFSRTTKPYEGQIIGYMATFRIPETLALSKHDWATITGRGYASRHDPQGRRPVRRHAVGRAGFLDAARPG